MKTLNCKLQAGPPSLQYYCAVVLHSCVVLPPVSDSSNHEYHHCQPTDNRAVFPIFIALLTSSFDSSCYNVLHCSLTVTIIALLAVSLQVKIIRNVYWKVKDSQ